MCVVVTQGLFYSFWLEKNSTHWKIVINSTLLILQTYRKATDWAIKSLFFSTKLKVSIKMDKTLWKYVKILRPGSYISTRLWLFVKRHAFPHHLTPYFYCSFANPRLITKFPFFKQHFHHFLKILISGPEISLKSFWATPYCTSVIMKLIESSLHYKQVCFVCWSISEESISNVFFFGQILCQSSKHFLLLER